jgi:DNA repair protein RecO (recombination protein O)
MEWSGEAIVLGAKPFGEGKAIAELFTPDHGRVAGVVHGGSSRRMAGVLQVGNRVHATWKARLAEQLGFFAPLELEASVAAALLEDKAALNGLSSAVGLVRLSLPERQAYPAVYAALALLTEAFVDKDLWPPLYVRFELGLLAAAGYGLDLGRCALTGTEADLAYVSPKSGRAANREAAADLADKLLRLPAFLVNPDAPIEEGDVADAFALCGHFLERRIADPKGEGLPDARRRLIEHLGMSARL